MPTVSASAAPDVSLSCARAADAAARCAAECLGLPELHDRGHCSEWCLLAARTLGACSDLLRSTPHESHLELVVAIGRAGIIAAESCAVECSLHADDVTSCAAAADACRLASADLSGLIDELALLAESTGTAVA